MPVTWSPASPNWCPTSPPSIREHEADSRWTTSTTFLGMHGGRSRRVRRLHPAPASFTVQGDTADAGAPLLRRGCWPLPGRRGGAAARCAGGPAHVRRRGPAPTSRPRTTSRPGRRCCASSVMRPRRTAANGLRICTLGSGSTAKDIALTAMGRNPDRGAFTTEPDESYDEVADRAARDDVGGDVTEQGRLAADWPTSPVSSGRPPTGSWRLDVDDSGRVRGRHARRSPNCRGWGCRRADGDLPEDLAAPARRCRRWSPSSSGSTSTGTLEAGVRPFVEWTRTWADLEKKMTEFWRPPSGSSG